MTMYRRTAIRKLSVQRYRSLKAVVLEDLPEIIVLYGRNGSGKSNILRATQLLLRAAGRPGPLPTSLQEAVSLSLPQANLELDLRPDDFRHGDLPEIRIALEIELGTRAKEIVRAQSGHEPKRLELQGVFQSSGDRGIRYWFERAWCDNGIELGMPSDPSQRGAINQLVALRLRKDQLAEARQTQESRARDLPVSGQETNGTDPAQRIRLASSETRLRELTREITQIEEQILGLDSSMSEEALLAERIQRVLIPKLLQTSEAYRTPGGNKDPQRELFQAFLSEDPAEREATRRLSHRLAKAALFDVAEGTVGLLPVESQTYQEKQIRFRHPIHGELPLRNLGSGEQQVVLMLAQRVITPHPVAHLEEPEAHLHKTLMEPLAALLRESVLGDGGPPDVDQLWMATHHHYFAIAQEFFDVSIGDEGQTLVERRKRDEAAVHFYEPSPYWDTLRGLVESGMSPDQVVSIDAQGAPVRAKDILASIQGDRHLADDFVRAATKAFVLTLVEDGSQK